MHAYTLLLEGVWGVAKAQMIAPSADRALPAGNESLTVNVTNSGLFWQIDAAGGWVREASTELFPIASDMSGAVIRFAPGGLRQIHWHPTLSEWQFVINGTLRVSHHACILYKITCSFAAGHAVPCIVLADIAWISAGKISLSTNLRSSALVLPSVCFDIPGSCRNRALGPGMVMQCAVCFHLHHLKSQGSERERV